MNTDATTDRLIALLPAALRAHGFEVVRNAETFARFGGDHQQEWGPSEALRRELLRGLWDARERWGDETEGFERASTEVLPWVAATGFEHALRFMLPHDPAAGPGESGRYEWPVEHKRKAVGVALVLLSLVAKKPVPVLIGEVLFAQGFGRAR